MRLLLTCLLLGLLGCGSADGVKAAREELPEAATVVSRVNACPSFAFSMIVPQALQPHEVALVMAFATDVDSDDTTLGYAWSATAGAFSEPDAEVTEYSCADAGPQVLSVTAWDRDGCEKKLDLDVTCPAP